MPGPPGARLSDQALLPRRVYPFRVLGMGMAMLPIAGVIFEIGAAPFTLALLIFSCLLWPHLAYLLARRSADPFRAELRNLMIDSVFAGLWVPLMHFNALPSVLLLTVASADKINTGVRGLWLRSLPGMVLAVLVGGLFTHFALRFDTSLTILLACLPLLVIHTLAVSLDTYRLIRKVQGQNQQLDALSRIDTLTGLANRRHWQDGAETLLHARHAHSRPATLLLMDIDLFKAINDEHGHIAGDDVLRSIADLIRHSVGPVAQTGRLGGDEFAIALPGTQADAEIVAERLRRGVEALSLTQAPALRCSVSIGLAEATAAEHDLRAWVEAADRALYRAKREGRNRTLGSAVSRDSAAHCA
ncbi:MAG: diguanylate cyclase [Metallibacterium sp.]